MGTRLQLRGRQRWPRAETHRDWTFDDDADWAHLRTAWAIQTPQQVTDGCHLGWATQRVYRKDYYSPLSSKLYGTQPSERSNEGQRRRRLRAVRT